jgi:CAAX protease family protein
MGVTLLFFCYLSAAYLLAGVLALPLSGTIQGFVPLDAFIARMGMLLALLGFWPLLRALDLADRASLGFALGPAKARRALGLGLVLGSAILMTLVGLLLLLGCRAPTPGVGIAQLPGTLVKGLLGGLAVALMEETFFRGALYSALRRRGGPVAAIAWSSLLYAALHFFQAQPLPPGAPVSLQTILASIAGAFPALFTADNLDSLVALWLAGAFLALLRERSGHIVWGIGLHAGWVLVIRVAHVYSDVDHQAPWHTLVGSYDGVTGWLAALWIGLLTVPLALWPRRQG